jgi:(p)ppGpp synthase/HD superfamily hydrolase
MYILDTIENEKIRRVEELEDPQKNYSMLVKDFSEFTTEKDRKKIHDFYRLLLKFEYSHPGLDKLAYMAHPIRVARLYISYCENFCIETLKLALAHNLLELTGLDEQDLTQDSLKPISHMIKKLTVDRSRQWDWDYKNNYYEQISVSSEMSVVKVLDKLDNLYLLSNNPNRKIKLLYLNEIEKFIMPLVSTFVPKLESIISDLVIFNKKELEGDTDEI